MSKDAKAINTMTPAAPQKSFMDKMKAQARTGGCIVVWLALAAIEMPMKNVAKGKAAPGKKWTDAQYNEAWKSFGHKNDYTAADADALSKDMLTLNHTSNMCNWWQLVIIAAICVPMVFAKFGTDGLKSAFGVDQIKLFGPTSICFAAARMFKQPTAGLLPSDLEKVISGLETVMIALMFAAAGRHHYSMAQWACLACVPVVVVLYAQIKDAEKTQNALNGQVTWLSCPGTTTSAETPKTCDLTTTVDGKDVVTTLKNPFSADASNKEDIPTGMMFMSGYLICMLGGTFFGEVAFKKKMPFLVQKSTDAVIGLIFFTFMGLAVFPFFPQSVKSEIKGEDNSNKILGIFKDRSMYFWLPTDKSAPMLEYKSNGGFMWGWTGGYAVFFLFLMIAKQIMSNILVKYLDSTVKQICKTFSTTLVFFTTFAFVHFDLLDSKDKITPLNFAGILAVTFAVGSYVVASMYTKNKAQWRKMAKDLKAMQEGPAEELPVEAQSAEKAKLLPK